MGNVEKLRKMNREGAQILDTWNVTKHVKIYGVCKIWHNAPRKRAINVSKLIEMHKKVRNISKCNNLYQNAICTKPRQNVQNLSNMYQTKLNVPKRSKMYQNSQNVSIIPKCINMHKIYKNATIRAKTRKMYGKLLHQSMWNVPNFLNCTKTRQMHSKYSKMYQNSIKFNTAAKMYKMWNAQNLPNTPKCVSHGMYQNAQKIVLKGKV